MRRLLLLLAFLATPFAIAHDNAEKHVHAKYFKNNVGGWTVITDKTKWLPDLCSHNCSELTPARTSS